MNELKLLEKLSSERVNQFIFYWVWLIFISTKHYFPLLYLSWLFSIALLLKTAKTYWATFNQFSQLITYLILNYEIYEIIKVFFEKQPKSNFDFWKNKIGVPVFTKLFKLKFYENCKTTFCKCDSGSELENLCV